MTNLTAEHLDDYLRFTSDYFYTPPLPFTCCQSCGHTEIGDALEDDEFPLDTPYVFLHQQSADDLLTQDPFTEAYLYWGNVSDDQLPTLVAEVQKVLPEGLTATCKGPGSAIAIRPKEVTHD